jgi:hypothetical protein
VVWWICRKNGRALMLAGQLTCRQLLGDAGVAAVIVSACAVNSRHHTDNYATRRPFLPRVRHSTLLIVSRFPPLPPHP